MNLGIFFFIDFNRSWEPGGKARGGPTNQFFRSTIYWGPFGVSLGFLGGLRLPEDPSKSPQETPKNHPRNRKSTPKHQKSIEKVSRIWMHRERFVRVWCSSSTSESTPGSTQESISVVSWRLTWALTWELTWDLTSDLTWDLTRELTWGSGLEKLAMIAAGFKKRFGKIRGSFAPPIHGFRYGLDACCSI